MKGLKLKKKEPLTEEEKVKVIKQKTAQQWMPVADIKNSLIYRKDNILVGMFRVEPLNLELLSDNEKRRIVDTLAEGLNGETESFQIFCIGRPVDLNNYLDWLQEKAKNESDYTRKNVLKGFIQQAFETARSGEVIERRFYLIVTKKYSNEKSEKELLTRLTDLQSKFLQAGLKTKVCNEDELMDVLSLFANPIEMAFEQVALTYNDTTILE